MAQLGVVGIRTCKYAVTRLKWVNENSSGRISGKSKLLFNGHVLIELYSSSDQTWREGSYYIQIKFIATRRN